MLYRVAEYNNYTDTGGIGNCVDLGTPFSFPVSQLSVDLGTPFSFPVSQL